MALIRIEDLSPGCYSTLRGFHDSNAKDMAAFDLVATIRWELPDVCWLSAMHGRLSRSLLFELLQALNARGIRIVRATRAAGHVLPRAVYVEAGGYFELDITPYIGGRYDSGLIPLTK
jgi:hypothetical protein